MTATQGDLLADEGAQRAMSGADEGWLRAAKHVVWQLIQEGQPWTTDQIWYRLEALGVTTQEPRALGAVVRSAQRKGFIQQVGYRPTTRPEAHARPIPIWLATGKRSAAA